MRVLLAEWLERVAARIRPWPKFKPCVVYHDEMRLTEVVLEDASIVWCPWRATAHMGHTVDLGYDLSGKLVGVQIWDDVRERTSRT